MSETDSLSATVVNGGSNSRQITGEIICRSPGV